MKYGLTIFKEIYENGKIFETITGVLEQLGFESKDFSKHRLLEQRYKYTKKSSTEG